MSFHDQIQAADNHGPYRQLFADSAARLADASTYTDSDVTNRVTAIQLDDLSIWVLTNNAPNTWEQISGGGGSSAPLNSLSLSDASTTNLNAATVDNVVPWGVEIFKDSGFTHSTVTNNSRIEVDQDGTYLVSVAVRVVGNPVSTPRYQGKVRLRANGTTDLTGNADSTYARFNDMVDHAGFNVSFVVKLSAGDYFEVLIDRDSTRTTAMDMEPNDSMLHVVNLAAGPKGDPGPQGPPGTGDVNGPGSAVDGSVPTYSGTTGKQIQDPATMRIIGRALCVEMVNKTGGALSVGYAVTPDVATSVTRGVNLAGAGSIGVVGTVAEASASDGDPVWVAIAGIIPVACVAGSVAVGDFLESTATGESEDAASGSPGVFALAVEGKGVSAGLIEAKFCKAELF